MADRPLRPATHRCLGEQLPHQLANGTRAHPKAINLSPSCHATGRAYPVLAALSACYPGLPGRLPTCYSPVRHWVSQAASCPITPFDLHVLGTPPAFVLSQDQTLRNIMKSSRFPFTDRLGCNRVRCSPGSACAARVMRFHLYDVTSHGMFLFSFQRAKTFSLPLSQQELHLTSFFALCQLPLAGKSGYVSPHGDVLYSIIIHITCQSSYIGKIVSTHCREKLSPIPKRTLLLSIF